MPAIQSDGFHYYKLSTDEAIHYPRALLLVMLSDRKHEMVHWS